MNSTLSTPVALFVFRRPETTRRVFEVIRQVQPQRLYVVADGPRPNIDGETATCAAVRRIVERVDWPCDVERHYSSTNLGLRQRVISGLSWVFDQVDEAIILEDDCLPHPTFFSFSQELLARYRDEPRIAMISGNNFQGGIRRGKASYYFSVFNHIWGWAAWRRSWRNFDADLCQWPILRKEGFLDEWLEDPVAIHYWTDAFDFIHRRKELWNNWDYQWTFSCWAQRQYTVLPNVNLVSNIGFGEDATSGIRESPVGNLPVEAMPFPLLHTPITQVDREADRFSQEKLFGAPLHRSLMQKLKERSFEMLPWSIRRLNRRLKRIFRK